MKEIDAALLARQIDAYCAANGIQKQEFTDQTGISTATLSQWRKGKYKPGQKSIAIIEDFTNMPIEALLYGHPSIHSFIGSGDTKNEPATDDKRDYGDISVRFDALDQHGRDALLALMEVEEARMKRTAEHDAAEIVPIRTIRHYFSGPAAGVNGLVDGEDYEDIPLPAGAPEDADYCLTVSGDSMEPYFADGDMVYVKRDVPLRDFEVGVFAVDGATYIKQFCKGVFGEVYLLSANPKRESANLTIRPDGNQSIICQGKVITNKKLPQPIYD